MNLRNSTPDPKKLYTLPDDYLSFADENLPFTIEESLGTFYSIWDIDNCSELTAKESQVRGPIFKTDLYEWNIDLYPLGNDTPGHLSIYLESLNDLEQDICAQVSLCIVDPTNPTRFFHQEFQHRYTKTEKDWGFQQFMELKDLLGEGDDDLLEGQEPFVIDDCVRIISIVRLIKDPTGVLWHNFYNYDSKAMTGYVGLYNQGATCYMNSLFQSLFFTNLYRKAVYQVPTENDDPNDSIVFALQRLFYRLQFSHSAISTLELTKSFGWNTIDAFMQHDVQEFNRLLQDTIEKKMKDTPAQDAIKQLFVGKMKSYIKCINVEYESSRTEDYYDIQLNVKGCKNLEESFRNYVSEETLEGDNKYMAEEEYGLQDAKKGVIFESFPSVLHLQLKRFEYDMIKDSMIKINDRHEFPTEIDLAPYLSESAADKSSSYKYALHGVLVHTGDLTGGHYFAFVRPTKEDKWFKFDDDRVTPATLNEVLEDNFGGETEHTHPRYRKVKRMTNAYMLVYIRESYQDEVLASVTEHDIPTHLIESIKQEQAIIEEQNKQRAEQHLYMTAYMTTDKSFKRNTGRGFISEYEQPKTADEEEKDPPPVIEIKRVLKSQTLEDFHVNYAKEHDMKPNQFRIWNMMNRRNETVRLDTPFTNDDYDLSLEEICHRVSNHPSLRLHIEYALYDETEGNFFFHDQDDYLVVFIKLFDPLKQTLRALDKIYVSAEDPISSIEDISKEMANIPNNTEIEIYEEVNHFQIELLDAESKFDDNNLFNGDILIIQAKLPSEQTQILKQLHLSTNVIEYFNFLYYRIQIIFAPIQDPSQELRLVLRDDMLYEDIVSNLGKCIQQPQDHILLMISDKYGNPDAARGIVRNIDGIKLSDIRQLIPKQAAWNKLYYDVLSITVSEYESKKWIKLNRLLEQDTVDVGVSRLAKISDLYAYVTREKTAAVRIYQVEYNKITYIFEPNEIVGACIQDGATLFAEIIPDEEINIQEGDYFISVYHYQKELTQAHSIPFKFLVIKNEEFNQFKKRLQRKSKIMDENVWNHVSINFITRLNTIHLKEDNYQKYLFKPQTDQVEIGLDHMDPNGRYIMDSFNKGGLHFKD